MYWLFCLLYLFSEYPLSLYAQFDLNFCSLAYNCSEYNLCGPLNIFFDGPISDRTGYVCQNSICVAPYCSKYLVTDAWAPPCSDPINTVCAADHCDPIEPKIEMDIIGNGVDLAGTCQDTTDCLPTLFCDWGDSTCKERHLPFSGCENTCNSQDECLKSYCIMGHCEKSLRNIGQTCDIREDCISKNCTDGICGGYDCSTFNCINAGYFCGLDADTKAPVCFPDYKLFNCDLKSHYPERTDPQKVACKPKKPALITCTFDYECLSGFCNNKKCVTYSKLAIPFGEYCSIGGFNTDLTVACGRDLYCNSSNQCDQLRQKGEACFFSSECAPGLKCIDSDDGYFCSESATLNKPCGWSSQGYDNCTSAFNEICVCFGTSTPSCVSSTSNEYQARLKAVTKYDPITLVSYFQPAHSLSLCINSVVGFDLLNEAIPTIISPSYIKYHSPQCQIKIDDYKLVLDFDTIFGSEGCRKLYAKIYCCFFCSTKETIDNFGFSKTNKNFSSGFLAMGPQYQLTCGSDPDFIPKDINSCQISKFSWEDWNSNLQCSSSGITYYKVIFTINGISSKESGETLIRGFLSSRGISPPDTLDITSTNDIYIVQLFYFSPTEATKAESAINTGFNNYVSNTIFGASSTTATTLSNNGIPLTNDSSVVYFSMFSCTLVLLLLVLFI